MTYHPILPISKHHFIQHRLEAVGRGGSHPIIRYSISTFPPLHSQLTSSSLTKPARSRVQSQNKPKHGPTNTTSLLRQLPRRLPRPLRCHRRRHLLNQPHHLHFKSPLPQHQTHHHNIHPFDTHSSNITTTKHLTITSFPQRKAASQSRRAITESQPGSSSGQEKRKRFEFFRLRGLSRCTVEGRREMVYWW